MTGDTFFADVSQFQGVPVNATYQYPIFSFRVCDGTYFDPLAEQNWAASKALLNDPAHPLALVWVYFVFRPGTWDSIAASIQRVFGSDMFPSHVAAMIDVEPWEGQLSGNHSTELNQWASNLAQRTATGQASVVGYSYQSGFQELWPQMAAWIKRHTAAYGTSDPSPYGWQYSGGSGTGGLLGWPHGAGPWPLCDMNVIRKPIATILADFGYEAGEDMTPEQSQQLTDLWNWFKGARIPPGQTNLGSTIAATLPAAQATFNKVNAVSTQVSGIPTTAQVATMLAKIPGEITLTPEQLAALTAALGELAAPNYSGHATISISPDTATP